MSPGKDIPFPTFFIFRAGATNFSAHYMSELKPTYLSILLSLIFHLRLHLLSKIKKKKDTTQSCNIWGRGYGLSQSHIFPFLRKTLHKVEKVVLKHFPFLLFHFSTVCVWSLCCCCWVAKSCLALCDPMDCSIPGSSVLHYLLELAQIHVHWVSNAIQPSHPLSAPSPLPSVFPSIRVFSNELVL